MAIQTFEYCSLHYLNQWLNFDRNFCKAFVSRDKTERLETLKKAGSLYRVARNLPRKYDLEKGYKRYGPVLDILDSVDKGAFVESPVKRISEIARKISKKYGDRNVLSLTTKFLWFKFKSPIKIYDSQAKTALGATNGDLSDFYQKWNSEFDMHRGQIESACSKLPDLHLFAVDQKIGTREYIQEVSVQQWFHERVFDIFLWSKGNRQS